MTIPSGDDDSNEGTKKNGAVLKEEAPPSEAETTKIEEGSSEDLPVTSEQDMERGLDSPEDGPNGHGFDGGDDDDDDDDVDMEDPTTLDARQRKLRHWEQSPFAVGCVNVRWQDDRTCFRPKSVRALKVDATHAFSACICGCIGAGRVGNLAVLAQTSEEYDHVEIVNQETGECRTSRRKRPKLLCVVGPYWYMNVFVTFPLILGISAWVAWNNFSHHTSLVIIISWSFCTFLMIFSLLMIACRDPGVLYKHPQQLAPDWRWNDQAKTYRPPKARFDPECQVVVEGFDHTCPWTGTAIGSRNMFWFRIFVTMVPVCIAYSVVVGMLSIS